MRFFLDQPLALATDVELPETVWRHLHVLRLQAGVSIVLFNGDGHDYDARLTTLTRRAATAEILTARATDTESPLRLHLALVMSKGDRLDWALQKSTELGVYAIHLLSSERCEVHLHDAARRARKLEHWQQILLSACEQCGRNVPPHLTPPRPLLQHLAGERRPGFILDPNAGAGSWPEKLANAELELLIGPEGGFSAAEVAAATAADYRGLRLGPRILRTETAPLAALSVLQHRYGDLH